jgi:TolA-binding protein
MEATRHQGRKALEAALAAQERATANVQLELEKRTETAAKLEAELERVKKASIATVADYKVRFDKLQETIEAVEEAREQAVKDLHAAREEKTQANQRFSELNSRLGERIRFLQEDLKQEKETNGQVIVFASGSVGWEQLDPISVASKMVKDLREENAQKSRDLAEFEKFARDLQEVEESS